MTPLFSYPDRPRIELFRSRMGARIQIQGWLYTPTSRQPHGPIHEGDLTAAKGRRIGLDGESHYIANIARAWVVDQAEQPSPASP